MLFAAQYINVFNAAAVVCPVYGNLFKLSQENDSSQ